jgi:hypothetical protein
LDRCIRSLSRDVSGNLVIQHDPNPLFDILGHLLALAIHDDIFIAELKDTEYVYRLEIPRVNDIELPVKGTKLDLPIFRWPKRPVNEYRKPTTIGLLRSYAVKPMKMSLPSVTTASPFLGTQAHPSLQPVTASISRPPKRP